MDFFFNGRGWCLLFLVVNIIAHLGFLLKSQHFRSPLVDYNHIWRINYDVSITIKVEIQYDVQIELLTFKYLYVLYL